MAHNQAVVWIEPREAQVFGFHADKIDRKTIARADTEGQAAARDSGNVRDEHLRDHRQFFEAVLASVEADLSDSGRWLIVGRRQPGEEFGSYVYDHAETLAEKLMGVEALDHPTEENILTLARERFGEASGAGAAITSRIGPPR